MTPSKDVWWNLVGDSKELSVTILGLLKEDGLPYLERFRSNEDVVREWERFGQSIGLPPRAALSIAIIYADQGKFAKAEDLLQQEYESAKHESYAKFVSEIAQKVGVSFPNDFEA